MNRRDLILGTLATLAYGCGKKEEPKLAKSGRNFKESEYIVISPDEPFDVLETVPLHVKGFFVGKKYIELEDLTDYVVKEGDVFSKIIERFYGPGQDWKEIYALNREFRRLVREYNPQYLPYLIGNNPHRIKPGQLIILEKAVEDFTLPKINNHGGLK